MSLSCLVDTRHTARTLISALFLLGMSNAQAATGLPASPDNPMPADGENTLSFDVSEGTSFAVAASPDGKHLAIDLQGSLWIVPANGGRAHRITDYYNDAHLPSWSPDGTKLTFYAFRDGSYNLWTVDAEGSNPSRITNGEFDGRDPAWSPDGKTIAFASERGGSYDIWTLDLANNRLNRLTSAPEADRAPVWSSDGSMLVFSRSHAGGSAIMAIAAAGGEPRELQSAPRGMHYLAPSLSPRGRLSYVVQDATGSRLQVDGETVSATQNVFPFRASWHGENAYYTADGVIRRHGSSGTSKVPFVARLEATRPSYKRPKRDFTSTAPRKVLGIQAPALSPDGKSIAFVALGDLYLVPSSGGKPERLTTGPAMEADAAWSPDGKTIAYTSDQGGGLPQLWLRDLATGNDRRITDLSTQPLGAAWSPDGTRVAFLDYDGLFGTAGLQVLDVSSGTVTRLQPSLPQPGRPTWSANGQYVALALTRTYSNSFREGSNQIWMVPANGRDAPFWRDADKVTLDTRGGGGPVWSPDGHLMAAIQEGLLKVWRVAADGTALEAPRALTEEISHAPSWSGDSRSLLFQAADKLKIVSVETGAIRNVPLDFTYRLDVPSSRKVIHVGALVDGVRDVTQTDRDIVIEGNRIAAIGPHDPHNHAGDGEVIEAPDLTAIPGLIDHHAHPQKDFGANAHLAWLAYGITTVRDPGNQPYDGIEDREASEAGVRIGPRIYTTGPLLEWKRTYYRMGVSMSGPDHLQREIARARALKYDLIKSYVRMPDLQQRELIKAAHAMGVPVASHEVFPATYSGIDNVEHLHGTSRRGFSPKQGPQGLMYDDVVQLLGHSRAVLTPTIFGSLNAFLADHPEYRDDPRLSLYPDWARAMVTQTHSLPPGFLKQLSAQRAGLKAVRDAGGVIVAGTDMVTAPNLIGELLAYVEAGFTPFEALQAATVTTARALNLDAGALEPGQLADIVLVEGDPRRDIAALFNVRKVVTNGRTFTVEQLLAMSEGRK